MTDQTRVTQSAEFMPSATRPPRQLIEDLIENLRKSDTLSTKTKTQFRQSIRLLDQCIESRKDEYGYADAVERAPWLTADVEQLKRNWQELRQTLYALYKCVRRGEDSHESLIRQFNQYAERFVDCEADEQCVLQAAFPGPAWTDEKPGPF